MKAPSVQQLISKPYTAVLTFWKVGHSHTSTQGLLSQRNRSGACQPSLRGLQGDLSWVASFSLNHKTTIYKFSGIEKHLGFQQRNQQQEGVISTLAIGEDQGLELKSHPRHPIFFCFISV